jgi:bifunctional non-homologous end joining protein LigD
VFEVKWDGVCAIFFLNKEEQILELKSRKDKLITHRYPELLSPLKSAINCKESAILDGEIVILDQKGFPDFQKHQRRMNVDHSKDIEISLCYLAFAQISSASANYNLFSE